MWTAAGCLVVLLALGANAFDRTKAKEGVTNFRVKGQNLHVDYIEKEIEKLEHEFDALSHPPEQSEIARVRARVRKLEDDECEDKEVSCGGDWPECVHHLLVCDGHKDCHNGRDEDEKICDGSVVHAGSSFRGIVHWHRCVEAHDHYSTITITTTKRSPFFTNRTFLRASVTREYDDHTTYSYTARGYFVYAARKLVIIADEGFDRLSTICTFNFGDNDHAECEVVQTASKQECGIVRMNRV